MKELNFFSLKTVHLVGIKGVAMASLAQCLDDIGVKVTGSDVLEDFVTKGVLSQRAFQIFEGFDPAHVSKETELVVYTGAHQGKNNTEVRKAVELGIPVMSHAQALGELMKGKKGISVCGTGGKSTTSAITAWVLDKAGTHPSFSVGVGNVNNFGTTGRYTQIHSEETDEISRSGWFVSEADEYAVDPTSDHNPRFSYQNPNIIVCTNLDYDHPDIYPTFEKMQQTFLDFFYKLPDNGTLIVNGDDEILADLLKKTSTKGKLLTVGTSEACDLQIRDIRVENKTNQFSLHHKDDGDSGIIKLRVPGEHNIHNASFAIAVAMSVGLSMDQVKEAIASFAGTMRRFEYKGKHKEVSMYDDYAHTPEEIRATIQALREWEPNKRVVIAFQPHTYSRTKALFDGFVEALSKADDVLLLDIFASAREAADTSITSDMLVDKLGSKAKNVHTIESLAKELQGIDKDCVVMTMGAGDVYTVYEHLNLA